MKNIFRILMAVAVLFTASCAKEDISSSIGSGEANVTFTVDLPELGTRYGEGSKVDILRYNVYEYGTETPLTQLSGYKEAQAPGQSLYTITIPMLKGMKYDIVFWAEKQGTGYYTLAGKEITVNYDNAIANDESRDAFFGSVKKFDPTNPGNMTSVELRRPFAQLNAITTDCQLIKKSGITAMHKSALKVTSKLHNQFNIFSGEATGEVEDVGFAINDIPAETKTIDDNTDMHLAMNYLLVNGEKALVDVKLLFVGKRGDAEYRFPVAQYSGIPVKRNYRTNIIGKLLTASTEFNVEIKADFGKSDQVVATDATAAQQALDNADKGTTIQLQPGVNYGTLLIRPVAGAANTITDCDYLIYRNEMLRKVEDLTIIGAPGAKVDGIKVVAGYVENSGSTGYVVDIKNLVIDGVEFSDDYVMSANHKYSSPVFVDLSYINVDGLTVKNCKLVGDNDKMNLVYLYGSGNPSNSTFNTAAKNITISNNVVDGIARLCELRQTENVTITGNTINNTYLHGMLLTVDKGKYSGNVTITDNIADGIKERFVRMAGAGDAVVVIKDNTILNYNGADADYIKVTDGTNVTIENNVVGRSVYGLTLIPNGANSKIFVNDKEGFLKLNQLFDDWRMLFTDGNVNDYDNYLNGAGSDYYYSNYWTVSLETDIDLNNEIIEPVIISHPVGTGDPAFNGNNHTIKNAKIETESTTENAAGLFKSYNCSIKNLVLDNIHVKGSLVSNSNAAILASICNSSIDAVTIKNSSVWGGKYTGAVVGSGYTKITNCNVENCVVEGGYKLGGIIGYICTENGSTSVDNNTLTDCTVAGTKIAGTSVYAGGKNEYIAGKVVGNFNTNGTCLNNTVTNMTTIATENIGKIEAGKTVQQQ